VRALEGIEFIELYRYLDEGAVVRALRAEAERPPAMVELDAESYLAGLRRHRGRVVMQGAEQ
jgi:hypothetical protein